MFFWASAWSMMLPATLLGGVLGTYLGLRLTILVGVIGRGLAGLIVLRSPVRTIRTLDDADALVGAYNLSASGPSA